MSGSNTSAVAHSRAARNSQVRLSPHKMLSIYLNDHLAGATGGTELSRRMARNASHPELSAALRSLAREVQQDRKQLREIMRALDVGVAWHKVALAWLAEKAGRVKLNGRVVRESPLSTLLELEAMRLGVEGKRAAWRSLRESAERDAHLNSAQLDDLLARADRQIDELESLRRQTAVALFDTGQGP